MKLPWREWIPSRIYPEVIWHFVKPSRRVKNILYYVIRKRLGSVINRYFVIAYQTARQIRRTVPTIVTLECHTIVLGQKLSWGVKEIFTQKMGFYMYDFRGQCREKGGGNRGGASLVLMY